ncbi:MAG: TolC family protein, partial [Gemmatimonadales bacterium]
MSLLTLVLAVALQGAVIHDSVTLAEALARARATRPMVAGAAAGVAEARGAARTGMTVPNPVFSYTWTGDTPKEHATVTQPLDWLLRHSSDRAAGAAGVARAEADSVSTLAALARDVRVAFYDAVAAARSMALTEDQAALADSLARAADARLAAGDISELERDQVAQEAQRARYAVSLAREDDRVAAAALTRAVGGTEALIPNGALEDGLDAPIPAAVGLQQLPALRAALADSAASAARAHAQSISQLPLPDLQGGVEWNDPTDPNQGSTELLGIAIPLPLCNHGGGAAAEAKARARQDAAAAGEARLEATRALEERSVRL